MIIAATLVTVRMSGTRTVKDPHHPPTSAATHETGQ
jgi:hypothetical protein